MQGKPSFRALQLSDYDAVVALWARCEGVEVAEGDDRGTIAAYLERNPGLSLVVEVGGRIVAAGLAGHDGRRGTIYHLGVEAAFRRAGLGRQLVERMLNGLRECGVVRVNILVAKGNIAAHAFWVAQGFGEIAGAVALGRNL